LTIEIPLGFNILAASLSIALSISGGQQLPI